MKLGSSKFPRPAVAFLHDLSMAGAAFMIALLLRLGAEAWASLRPDPCPAILLFSAASGPLFLGRALYRGAWRYTTMTDPVPTTQSVPLALAHLSPPTTLTP